MFFFVFVFVFFCFAEYHIALTIPKKARNIVIKERVKSPHFLGNLAAVFFSIAGASRS